MSSLRTLSLLALLFVLASPSALTSQQPRPAAVPARTTAPREPAGEVPKTLSWHLLLGLGVVLVVGGGFLRRRGAEFAQPEAERGAKVTPLHARRAKRKASGRAKRIG